MLRSILLVHAQMPLRKKNRTRALKMERKGKRARTYKPRAKTKTEQQQKRIESNESMLAALFEKLNMSLPPNFACVTPMQDEPNDIGEASNGNNADNFGFD